MKKAIISLLSVLTGIGAGAGIVGKLAEEEINKREELANRHLALFLLMNQWVRVKQEGKQLASYFEKKKYKNIAIYGMNYVGETLVEELRATSVHISYAIDKKADYIYVENIELISLDDDFEPVDAIVVTAITFFDEIERELKPKMNCPIISIKNVLDEVERGVKNAERARG